MAVITDMGVPGTDFTGILQPFHKHRWSIKFTFPGAGTDGIQHLTAMAVTAERPKLEFEEIQLDRYNSRAFIFGKHMFQPISIVFEPDIGGQVHLAIIRQLEQQQHLIAPRRDRLMGQAEAGEDYKFGLEMTMWNGHHRERGERELEKWVLEGCGLQNNDFGDLDYQASETMKTTLNIRYDHARLIVTQGSDRMATGGSLDKVQGAGGTRTAARINTV